MGVLLLACARRESETAPVSTDTIGVAPAASAPTTAAAFEEEIARFEAADRAQPPDSGGIVFVGSSSFRLWPNLAGDFPGRTVLNRGFGGSTLPDVIHFAPRVVLPYRPRLVVLYAGDNDLAAGRSAEQVADDFRTFVRVVRQARPATRIAYVSIKPSPSRWALAEQARRANALIASEIARDSLAAFVDVFTPMLGTNGRPRPELFVADSLHMSPAGYVLWRERLSSTVR